jgi:hypothetical protein
MHQYAFKMKKYFVMKKMLTVVLLSFVLESISIPFLHKGTEAATSDIYSPKETMENMQNSTITRENQTADNQTDKVIPGVPEPI